jgi:hypothetical protein
VIFLAILENDFSVLAKANNRDGAWLGTRGDAGTGPGENPGGEGLRR